MYLDVCIWTYGEIIKICKVVNVGNWIALWDVCVCFRMSVYGEIILRSYKILRFYKKYCDVVNVGHWIALLDVCVCVIYGHIKGMDHN